MPESEEAARRQPPRISDFRSVSGPFTTEMTVVQLPDVGDVVKTLNLKLHMVPQKLRSIHGH